MSWPMVKIKDVAKVVTGKTPSTSEPANFGGDIPFITPAELSEDKYLGVPKVTLSELGAAKLKLVPEKSILVCCIGSLGKIGIAQQTVATNQQINTVCFDTNSVIPEYGYYALARLRPKLIAMAPATTVAIVSKSKFEELEIPIPPLAEQKRIAVILDKADAIRRKRQQAIQLADDFLRAVFLEMFGDPVTNPKGFPSRLLSDFYADLRNGTKCGPFGSALKKDEYQDCGIPVWNMDNISLSGVFNDSPNLWISDEKFADLEAYSVEDGDVIISRAGTVGKMGVVRSKYSKSIISTNLIRVRFGETLRPEYFVNLMIYCKGRIGRLKTGPDGSFTHMNTGILDTLEFPYPPIELQDKYLNIRKSVLAINERVGQYKIDLLFDSLSQKAFSGQL